MSASCSFSETNYSDGEFDFRIIEGPFPWQRIIDDLNNEILLVDISQPSEPAIRLSPAQEVVIMALEQNPQGLTNRDVGSFAERYGIKPSSATSQLYVLERTMREAFGHTLISREEDPNYAVPSGRRPNIITYRRDLIPSG